MIQLPELKVVARTFFDRDEVLRKMDRETLRFLRRIGGFVRLTARRSIKRAPKKAGGKGSPIGKPPYSRTGALRQNIFFAFDDGSGQHTVIIGPSKLNKPYEDAPAVLEYGGRTIRRKKSGEERVAIYPPRPYMRPAFDAAMSRLDKLWAESVK